MFVKVAFLLVCAVLVEQTWAECDYDYIKIFESDENMVSACDDHELGDFKTTNLEECEATACENKVSVLQWRPKEKKCILKQCEGKDLKLKESQYEGREIYVRDDLEPPITVCNGDSKFLPCPNKKVVQIEQAKLGRKDKKICQDKDVQANKEVCEEDVVREVRDLCNGRQECRFSVNKKTFGETCGQAAPYLVFSYRCINRN